MPRKKLVAWPNICHSSLLLDTIRRLECGMQSLEKMQKTQKSLFPGGATKKSYKTEANVKKAQDYGYHRTIRFDNGERGHVTPS